MHASDPASGRAARATTRIPLSTHLVAGALATLGALAMLAVLPLPGGLGAGALLIAAATLLTTWADRRHGRAGASAFSVDLPSALLLLLTIALWLAILLFPHDALLALRTLTGLTVGAAFFLSIRWEDRILTRRTVQERPAPASA
ncbi:hypothetical protein [Brachybacterium sacelli]|uniref:MFS family permease n=1 Tax=Brachybacterium sacelli TaxID=173364 RepID=A0ABS4WWF2_9MICO|nr:hypothetical protein [Brachybacterium sacelli]MBP2380476.1 MFS family permease [Brachybacterium sacelli]